MLTRIIAAGLMAGVISGVSVSAIQHATTVPIILKAEALEKASAKSTPHQHSEIGGDARVVLAHVHGPASAAEESNNSTSVWVPANGLERTAYTTLSTVGVAAGFALMLLSAMIAVGVPITTRQAALWGLGAFFATGLAPAVGLPPELPGSAAADLFDRQIWWGATAAATSAGIWLLFRNASIAAIAAGIVLIALPQIVGAPHTDQFTSTAPAELAGHFTAASLGVHAVMWVLTGALVGFFWQRFDRTQALK